MSRSVAVVTGAGAGIGRAIARELSRRDFTVIATDLDGVAAAAVASELGAPEDSAALDVTDLDAIERVAASVLDRHHRLDLWVSNAGVSQMAPFTDISPEDLDRTFAVNLKGVFLCGQVAARTMRALGTGGCIVNLASMAGKQGGVPFLADYVASKFGVVGLTQAMAFELAADRIRVNCVCPGFVATAMQERELSWEADLRGVAAQDVRRMWIEDTPMGRLEEPEDVARAVAFLAGKDAGFITGEALAVNGGAFMD